jgi:hypothetical protein
MTDHIKTVTLTPANEHCSAKACTEPDQWQPIETAPRDGTEFLTYAPGNAHAYYNFDRRPALVISKWKEGRLWQNRPDNMPTHWMPLPAAPKGEKHE